MKNAQDLSKCSAGRTGATATVGCCAFGVSKDRLQGFLTKMIRSFTVLCVVKRLQLLKFLLYLGFGSFQEIGWLAVAH